MVRLPALRRAVLVVALVVGLAVPAYFLALARVVPFAWDFRAYHLAARAALAGEQFVGLQTIPGVGFVYPPVAVVPYIPLAPFPLEVAYLLASAVHVAAIGAVALLVLRTVEAQRGPLPTADRALVGGFCLLSAPALAVLGQGQADAVLMPVLAVAFVALERGQGRVAGVAVAAATVVKLFPAGLAAWFVVRRAWRALAAQAVATVGALLGGLFLFGPGAYADYLSVLATRSRLDRFVGTVSPNFRAMTLARPFSNLLPQVDPRLYVPLGLALVAPVAWLVARRTDRFEHRLAGYLAALVAVVIASPASNVHYVVYAYFPLLTLAYVASDRRVRAAFVGALALVAVPVQPAQLDRIGDVLLFPPSVQEAVLAVVRPLLTLGSAPLWGLLLALAGCLAVAVERRPPAPAEAPTDRPGEAATDAATDD